MPQQLQKIIDAAWEDRANFSSQSAPKDVLVAVEQVIGQLNSGHLRVATREAVGQWTTHQWIKKAVLLSFRLKDNEIMRAGDLGFYDKVPTKFASYAAHDFQTGVPIVPGLRALACGGAGRGRRDRLAGLAAPPEGRDGRRRPRPRGPHPGG